MKLLIALAIGMNVGAANVESRMLNRVHFQKPYSIWETGAKSKTYFLVSDEPNDADQLLRRANALRLGDGVPQDLAAATQIYKKLAMNGNTRARYALARSYYLGEGIYPDLTKLFDVLEPDLKMVDRPNSV